jgi:sulfotransferase family protein
MNDRNGGLELTPEHAELAEKIQGKTREIRALREGERGAKDRRELRDYRRRKKIAKLELFRLESELRAAEEGRSADEPLTGALPDFLVIGAGKGGTTFLYHLLTQHPLVKPAASKEIHFFDNRFGQGVEWYRQNFPAPRHKEGRTTVTGEATPFMFWPLVPGRVAEVVPRARLIALLRNPVDRAYSSYQQMVRREGTTLTFEEVVGKEKTLLLEASQLDGHRREEYFAAADEASSLGFTGNCISKGLYVDQLKRWAEHFDDEQMLVLKSEDFFARPQEVLRQVFAFLGLPEWEPDPSVFERKRNSRRYEKMDPQTRRSLEEYFAPHNRRLYEYLGRDLGW